MKKQPKQPAVPEEVIKVEPVAVRYRTAAGLLECSESTVRKLVREGKLDAVKVGDDDRVTTASIRALTA
jgi:excisionase family DNA binding protein